MWKYTEEDHLVIEELNVDFWLSDVEDCKKLAEYLNDAGKGE